MIKSKTCNWRKTLRGAEGTALEAGVHYASQEV